MTSIRCILILFIFINILTSCKNVVHVIDRDIPSHTVSAKEIERLSSPYVEQYLKGKEYHLGEIYMLLNENLEGEVSLKYADESSASAPNVIEVTVDTVKNKMVEVKKIGKDSKIDPGRINFHQWGIDSEDAFNIIESLFKFKNGYRYDKVIISTNNIYLQNMEVWNVSIYDLKSNKEYWGTIDPYSGEVIESGIDDKNNDSDKDDTSKMK